MRISRESDYRKILKQELVNRCSSNPRYSLRAYARDLGINPARLSKVLNAKIGLSATGAEQIAKRLGLSASEKDYFCQLVLASDARSKNARVLAEKAIATFKGATQQYHTIHEDTFKIIADWYHYAIVDLLKTAHPKSDIQWIAGRLGISRYEAEQAIERLLKMNLLKAVRGKLIPADEFLTTKEVPSDAIKKFHRQTLQKAIEAIAVQGVDDRDHSAITAAISTANIPKYKELIKKFRREMHEIFESSKNKDEVYCLSIQFFKLTNHLEEK